jgi:hypothetical protein
MSARQAIQAAGTALAGPGTGVKTRIKRGG